MIYVCQMTAILITNRTLHFHPPMENFKVEQTSL